MIWLVTLLGALLGLLRGAGFKSKAFQAFAHLYTGALIGALLTTWDKYFFHMIIMMSVIETTCFIGDRLLRAQEPKQC